MSSLAVAAAPSVSVSVSVLPDLARVRAAAVPDFAPARRIIDAALRCVARWGVGKTTIDDVAREAGCGRATLYRSFPGGRDALFEAVVATEVARFFAGLEQAAEGHGSLEELCASVLSYAATQLTGHAALQFLLLHEPEAILPHLAFHRLDGALTMVSAVCSPLIAPWLADPARGAPLPEEQAARAAEWIARVILSYVTAPDPGVDLCDRDAALRFVCRFILPGLASSAADPPTRPTSTRG